MFAKGGIYFITQRCFQGRFLLAPSQRVTEIAGGVLAKATQLYQGVLLHDAVFLSSHFHLLVSLDSPSELPRFMGWLSKEISVRVGKEVGWRGAFFERRYDAAPVLDDEALEQRLIYLRAHGVKEGLVAHPGEWPGIALCRQLESGSKKRYPFYSATTKTLKHHTIRVAPLPGWPSPDTDESRRRHRSLSRQAVQSVADADAPVVGTHADPSWLREADPVASRPVLQRSPRVRCFASCRELESEYLETYHRFVEALRDGYSRVLELWRELEMQDFSLPGFGLQLVC